MFVKGSKMIFTSKLGFESLSRRHFFKLILRVFWLNGRNGSLFGGTSETHRIWRRILLVKMDQEFSEKRRCVSKEWYKLFVRCGRIMS
jgi:hypothetical protein